MTTPVREPDDPLGDDTLVDDTLVDDTLVGAAALAFALLRFESGAAHLGALPTPPGASALGETAYVFTPSWRRVPRADVPAFLAGLPSPALLSPTTARGVVVLTLLHELAGERAAAARKTFATQRAGVEAMAGQLGLADASRILLEFDEAAHDAAHDATHVVSLAAMRRWSERFGTLLGWGWRPWNTTRARPPG